jgi:hypothetical protein
MLFQIEIEMLFYQLTSRIALGACDRVRGERAVGEFLRRSFFKNIFIFEHRALG